MIKLIPEPYRYSLDAGTVNLMKGFSISFPEIWKDEIDDFMDFAHKLSLRSEKVSLNEINVIADETVEYEGYYIKISDNRISVRASSKTGCFYAMQSLKQLTLAYSMRIPCFTIEDKPRFSFRAFMLDVGRYFYSVSDVKKFIDLIALHKLNFLHLHLTEDQGWRVEIKKYPFLTQKSSKRSHTNFNARPHGGFYTQDDVKEIVAYAHKKHIKVIPEIDMPGHMQAALHAYPELGCFARKLPVATHWGIKHDILCGGKDEVLAFVKDVIDEITELFPDGLIHIGGDEAPKTRWQICPRCQAKIKELGLKNENELQGHFLSEVGKYISSKGYTAIMWNEDEISGKSNSDIIWMAWNVPKENHANILNEMKNGRYVINGLSEPNYLDLPYAQNTLERIYSESADFIEKNDRMIGLEAFLWTEFVPDMDNAFFKTFPRLGAFAEKAWSEEKKLDYKTFLEKIPSYEELLKIHGVTRFASVKRANPSKILGFFEKLWWERRQLCWHGLHNLVDNAKVKKKYSEKKKKDKDR